MSCNIASSKMQGLKSKMIQSSTVSVDNNDLNNFTECSEASTTAILNLISWNPQREEVQKLMKLYGDNLIDTTDLFGEENNHPERLQALKLVREKNGSPSLSFHWDPLYKNCFSYYDLVNNSTHLRSPKKYSMKILRQDLIAELAHSKERHNLWLEASIESYQLEMSKLWRSKKDWGYGKRTQYHHLYIIPWSLEFKAHKKDQPLIERKYNKKYAMWLLQTDKASEMYELSQEKWFSNTQPQLYYQLLKKAASLQHADALKDFAKVMSEKNIEVDKSSSHGDFGNR